MSMKRIFSKNKKKIALKRRSFGKKFYKKKNFEMCLKIFYKSNKNFISVKIS